MRHSRTGFWWTARGLRLRGWGLAGLALAAVAAPVLAGLGGQGWPMLVALTLAITIFRIATRPEGPPVQPTVRSLSRLAAVAAGQGLVVAVCYGIGLGLAASLGGTVSVPLALPLALVIGAAVLSRAIWKPLTPDFDAFLDMAARTLKPQAPVAAAPDADANAHRAAAERLLARIDPGASDAALEAMLETLPQPAFHAAARKLQARAAAGDAVAARALMLHLSRPAVARWLVGGALPVAALACAREDPVLTSLFARRMAELVETWPDAARDLPSAEEIEGRIATVPEAAQALSALAARIRQARGHLELDGPVVDFGAGR